MPQLTKQDVAEVVREVGREVVQEVVEEVVERVVDNKLVQKLGLNPGETLDDKLEQKLGLNPGETLDDKLGAFMEHTDGKFDGLAEALQVMNQTMGTLAKDNDLQVVKRDIGTIQFAVRATNDDLRRLNKKIEHLEQANT